MHSLSRGLVTARIESTVAVLAVLLSIFNYCGASAQRSYPYVGYQIHSWNDVREWPSLLLKGNQYFKIDFYFKDRNFCASQHSYDPADARGCFIMSHDPPVPTEQYSQPADVLSFLQNSTYRPFFERPAFPVYIAICFKQGPKQMCNSSDVSGQNYLSLIDEFFAKANFLIQNNSLSVEFIFDGDSTPVKARSCLASRWIPWVSTWINHPLPAFQDNATANGYNRFQVFDEMALLPLFQAAAALNFGKFATGKYPLLIWEPADQSAIESFANVYLKWATKRLAVAQTVPEMRFAINIDPIQFRLYSSTATSQGRAFNRPQSVSGSSPQVRALGHSGYVALATNQLNSTILSIYRVDPSNDTYSLVSVVVESLPATFSSFTVLPVTKDLFQLFVSTSTGVSVWGMQPGKGSPSPICFIPHPAAFLALHSQTSKQGASILVGLRYGNDSSTLFAEAFQVDAGCRLTLGRSYNIWAPQRGQSVLDASIAMHDQDLIATFSVLDQSETLQIYALHALTDSAGLIQIISSPKRIGVGSGTSLSAIATATGEVFVLETHGNSYCYNTEARNKRPTPKLCDSLPQSTPGVLTYSIGKLSAWIQRLTSANTLPIRSCDVDILHGTYNQGWNPSSTLLVDHNGFPVVVAFHEGWRGSDKDVSECGAPQVFGEGNAIISSVWQMQGQPVT